jgi:hypothetical protein
VSCQTDDDVDYVLKYSGEDNIVIGTDYGHNDQPTEIEALRNLKNQGGITARQHRSWDGVCVSRVPALQIQEHLSRRDAKAQS